MEEVKLIQLPKILDDRGNLSFFENNRQIPFAIKRVYWIYDVPGGEIRGGHGYKSLQEVVIALSGSFDVVLFDGKERKSFTLNRSYTGLYIPKMTWRHMENFSTNSVALIVADQDYNEGEYIRDADAFINLKKRANQ
jgi:dTDP-4-dehydrorhamnose 3,5-epimerase-like enzyme